MRCGARTIKTRTCARGVEAAVGAATHVVHGRSRLLIARVLYTRYCAFELSTRIFASIQRLARAVHIRKSRASRCRRSRGAQSSSATRGDQTARVPPEVQCRACDHHARGQPHGGVGFRFAVVDRARARNDGSLRCRRRHAFERSPLTGVRSAAVVCAAGRRVPRGLRAHGHVCRLPVGRVAVIGDASGTLHLVGHARARDVAGAPLRVPPGGRVAYDDAVHAPPAVRAHLSTGGK